MVVKIKLLDLEIKFYSVLVLKVGQKFDQTSSSTESYVPPSGFRLSVMEANYLIQAFILTDVSQNENLNQVIFTTTTAQNKIQKPGELSAKFFFLVTI